MKRAALVLVIAASCSKPQPGADSTAAATPSAGATTAAAAQPSGASSTKSTPVGGGAAQSPRTSGSTPAPTGDVIVGRVNEHGFDPETFLAITPAGGAQTRLSGSHLAGLGSVKGAEVWARGKREGNAFRVDTFEVRRANNGPVEDGIVSVSGTTVTVRTARGTLTYPDAPTDLRNAAGARVWITRPVAGQAPSFGVIRPN